MYKKSGVHSWASLSHACYSSRCGVISLTNSVQLLVKLKVSHHFDPLEQVWPTSPRGALKNQDQKIVLAGPASDKIKGSQVDLWRGGREARHRFS